MLGQKRSIWHHNYHLDIVQFSCTSILHISLLMRKKPH